MVKGSALGNTTLGTVFNNTLPGQISATHPHQEKIDNARYIWSLRNMGPVPELPAFQLGLSESVCTPPNMLFSPLPLLPLN